MAHSYTQISYSDTGYFSKLVTGYLAAESATAPLYNYRPDADGIAKAIEERAAYPVNRDVLVAVLMRQYEGLQVSDATQENIQSLLSTNTYTITTAHQPNLMTGYLYFVYKILHAIKLAETLNEQYPDKHFVPVYYMGSEDNDIEELGVFKFRGEKFVWDGSGQKGAVGRMATAGLKPLLEKLFKLLGPPGKNYDQLLEIITTAYKQQPTIGRATQYLANELFGRYGLVILNPDEAALKALYVPVMQDELLNSNAYPVITEQTALLQAHYKSQMFPRPINLFYLDDQLRERIERHGDTWKVLNTDIEFTEDEILGLLKSNPERFSPNVALRGLFQCTILPDVAFIGGGAEVAYWLQLKTLFGHYGVHYPLLLLRQSVMWIDDIHAKLRTQTGLDIPAIFRDEDELVKEYVATHGSGQWQTNAESEAMALIFQSLKEKATSLDVTLAQSADAALTKMKYQLAVLEKKMLRAEKKKLEVQLQRIERIKKALFPGNSLQERTDNFAEFYLQYGASFFDIVKDGIEPLSNKFLVIENSH